MTVVDVIVATVVLASSGLLLYRSVRRSAGGCHGCGGGCHGRASPPGEPLVALRRRQP